MDFLVRPYQPDDLEQLCAIADAAWHPIYDSFKKIYGQELFASLTPDPLHGKGDQVRRHATLYPTQLLVCEHEGDIVGFVTFMLDTKHKIGEIGNNAVDASRCVKGAGQAMYRAVFERFRAEGMRFAMVKTGLDNAHAPARRAYVRAGFDIHHEDIAYYKKLD